MARYVLVAHGLVTNAVEWDGDSDPEKGGWVPPKDHTAIQDDYAQEGWRYDGHGFTPPPAAAPEVPETVSPRQLRLALLGAGKLDAIEAFVSSSGIPEAARISWEYATECRRDDPLLNAMAEQLQPPLSGADIDRLFIAAAAIP